MKKALITILVLAVIALVIFLFTNSESEKSNYVVRIGTLPILANKLPVEIATREGFFEEEGIMVQLTELASSNLMSDALNRGDVDVTTDISFIPFLNAQAIDPGKVKVFSVSDMTPNAPFDSILVKPDSNIRSPKDLSGKKVGVFPGTTATNLLKLFLKEKGVDVSKIQFVQLPPPQQITSLTAGAVDALFTYEPTVSIGLVAGMRRINESVYSELLNHNPLGVGLINSEFIKNYPEEAKRVVRALNKAYKYLRTNDKKSRELAASLFKFDEKVASSLSLPYHMSEIDKKIVDDFLNLLVEAGDLKSKPDLSGAYYKP